jgi:uncharacterized protein (TIGR02246 family)
MKNIITLLTVIGLFLSTSCNQQKVINNPENEAKVAEQLMQIWKEFYEAMNDKDIDKMMSYFTEDYINYPSYGSTQVGFEETKNFLENFIKNLPYQEFNLEQIEVKVLGDFAFEVTSDKNQRGFSIFKKQSDGSWKFYRWIGQQKRDQNNITN